VPFGRRHARARIIGRPRGKRLVVQGLGNVGYHAAKFCREQGAVIVALAEREGAIHNPKGLNEDEVFNFRKRTGSLLGFPGATDILRSADALELECDVLVPAALENVLTSENAARIKARIILEGANGPTTPEADDVFRKKGIMVIPDVFANAGGVTVSYFEWLEKSLARAARPHGSPPPGCDGDADAAGYRGGDGQDVHRNRAAGVRQSH
jgi:glutamate dehydrogenase (NAD(P)+)